jgi:hypothetical protein
VFLPCDRFHDKSQSSLALTNVPPPQSHHA